VNLQGQIIGINTAIATNSGGNEGIGSASPANLVRKVMNELLTKGKVTRAYLGVKLDSDFNSSTAQRLKLERVRGARVVEVYEDTPASRSGLKFDDVLVTFDGVEVQDENHLINLVKPHRSRSQSEAGDIPCREIHDHRSVSWRPHEAG